MVIPDTVIYYSDSAMTVFSPGSLLIARATITNKYENLLEGPERVNGTISVQSFGIAPRTVVIPLVRGNLMRPPIFQGNIALAPGRAAELSTLWTPIASDGRLIFEGTPFVNLSDSARVYGPLTCEAWSDVQLFERVQPIRFGGIQYTMVFKVIFIPSAVERKLTPPIGSTGSSPWE
jgi:hypothetical protein